jgi:hypothetical protein
MERVATKEQKLNRRAWVKALRSGKYKQCREELTNEKQGRFCCLGVACEVLIRRGYPINKAGESYDNETGELPDTGMYALGLTEFGHNKLVELNDEEHRRFKTIANYIESHSEELFEN